MTDVWITLVYVILSTEHLCSTEEKNRFSSAHSLTGIQRPDAFAQFSSNGLTTDKHEKENVTILRDEMSQYNLVGIATDCELYSRGARVRVPVESRIFTSPYCPDRLWGPPSLLTKGYKGLFPRE
jgi:hypothetical protein